jgi:hypothetical protein
MARGIGPEFKAQYFKNNNNNNKKKITKKRLVL